MQKKHLKKLKDPLNKSKNKIPQPISKNSIKNQMNINLINNTKLNSRKKKKNVISNFNNKNKSLFKDSLDDKISESKTNILIPDSLDNSKRSLIDNNIRYISDNYLDNLNNKKDNNLQEKENNKIKKGEEEETKKIDYRYYTNYPVKDYLCNNQNNLINEENKENKKYWLATYDKMMKKQKIIKILNYYSKENKYKENDIKENLLEIKDFEIYYPKQSNQPLIKYNKEGFIFSKLYLLTLENINFLLSYMNRKEINIKSNELDSLIVKGNFNIFTDNNNFKYNIIYFLGTFLNINIYGFSNIITDKNDNNKINNCNNNKPNDNIQQNIPNSKKVAKLVKILMNNFPKYDSDYYINYLLSNIKFQNYSEKINEIKNYIFSKNTVEIRHNLINTNYLTEFIAFNTSITATSVMTPYSTVNDKFFSNNKNCISNNITTKCKESFNKIKINNDYIGKYETFIRNNLYCIDKGNKSKNKKNKKSIGKNIVELLSSNKEEKKSNNNIKMNYIKIGLKKNVSNSKKNNYDINDKKNKNILLFPLCKNTNNKNNNSNTKVNERSVKSKLKKKLTFFNKNYHNKTTQEEKLYILPKFSLINNNIITNSNNMSKKKLICIKKKKQIKKPSIFYDKNKAQKFFYNTELQEKCLNKSNANYDKTQNINNLLDSLDLNNYLIQNNNNQKSFEKNNKTKKEKSKNKGIYVVDRRIKTDIEDDDSSLILLKDDNIKRSNKDICDSNNEFITPHSKKKKKFYS